MSERYFIVLFGPPAVGKMAVGDDVSDLTGIPLFHNHLSIEPVLRFFPKGGPAFRRIVDAFRESIFTEVAASDLPGLIFTFVWDFSDETDTEYMAEVCGTFDRAGAHVLLVELTADLQTRLQRNRGEKRLREKPSKRDIERSEERLLANEDKYAMNSVEPLPWKHIIVDTMNLSSMETARKIVSELGASRYPWRYREGADFVVMEDPDGNLFCVVQKDGPSRRL